MNILITLSGKNYMAQAKAQIAKDGSFISEKFSSYGTALKAGTYKVEISSSIVSLQPVDVQKLLGSKGGIWLECRFLMIWLMEKRYLTAKKLR